MNKAVIVIISLAFIASACNSSEIANTKMGQSNQSILAETPAPQVVNFESINSKYKFQGELPKDWLVEYVKETDSLNIYDPSYPAESNLEKSQIFIRNFTANTFLTLSTVDILSREEVIISGKQAVKYEINKKPTIANFINQPAWRSEKHRLLDIRLTNSNPSIFYVFAYSPDLNVEIFNTFISTLKY